MLTRREAFATFEVEVLHFVGGLGSNRAERVAVSRRPVEPDLDNASAGTVDAYNRPTTRGGFLLERSN